MDPVMSVAILSGGASLLGSRSSARQSQRNAREQMRFQDAQSRTGYQRAVADMKKAGINPMLASKIGPSPAMSGAMGQVPDYGASFASGLNAGSNVASASAQYRKTEADTALSEAQARVADATIEEKKQAIKKMESEVTLNWKRRNLLIQQAKTEQERQMLVKQQAETEKMRTLLEQANAEQKAVVAYYYEQLKQEGVLFEALIPKINYVLVQGKRAGMAAAKSLTNGKSQGDYGHPMDMSP